MTFRTFPLFVWILAGLLAISAGVLSLGQRDDQARPSADSYGPSGTSAMLALIQRHGYRVRIDRRSKPRIGPHEVAVAFEAPTSEAGFSQKSTNPFVEYLRSAVATGGRAIILPIPGNFLAASRKLLASGPTEIVSRGDGVPMGLYVDSSTSEEATLSTELASEDESNPSAAHTDEPSVGLWDVKPTVPSTGSLEPASLVRAYRVGQGTMIAAQDGTFTTNRFLDRGDDAQACLKLVAMLAVPGDTLVFTEAAFGNIQDPGLMEAIGPWASAGWQQFLFLAVVVIFSLGKRFGIPDEYRPSQRGSRELMDAISDTYLRGRQTKAAMRSAYDRSIGEIRTSLRLPREIPDEELYHTLPESLREGLSRLRNEIDSVEKTNARDALGLVAKVRTETSSFIGHRTNRTGLK